MTKSDSPCLIDFIDDDFLSPEGFLPLAEEVANAACLTEGVENMFVSVTLVNGDEIRRVNREMRGVDRETDVLSFPSVTYAPGRTAKTSPKRLKTAYDPAWGRVFLGDIVLNTQRAKQQAAEYGHSYRRELGYLTAHAMFHLMGYDHMTDADQPIMRQMEKKAMSLIRLYREEDNPLTDKNLQALAIEALELSYSPYSKFRVGACLLSEDGQVFKGANFENASYGGTICAERCAVSNAIAHGVKKFTKVAIACDNGYAWPCGICRQVLNEFKANGDMEVMVGGVNAPWKTKMLSELLPESFGPSDLNIQEG